MAPMNNRLMRPRAKGGFDPKSITGLIMWLDASDSSTITPASQPLADTGAITTWSDKSGLGQSMVQNNAVNRPTYLASGIGGKPAISFTRTGSQFMAGTFSHALTQCSMFFVGSVGNQNDRMVSLVTAGNVGDFVGAAQFVPLLASSTTNVVANINGNVNQVGRTITNDTPFISHMSNNGTTLSHRVNNGTAATASQALNGTYGTMVFCSVFSNSYNSGFTGRMAEILFYNRQVSDSENAAIIAYLSKKYGIAVS